MREISRRTVLEQAGLTLAAAVGFGSVQATSLDDGRDALEEVRDSLADLHEELDRAEDQLEELEHGGGFGDSGFDSSGDNVPADEALEEVEDEVVINGVPASRLVPANQTNGTNSSEFEGTVRVNGVPVAVKSPGGNASGDDSTTDSGAIPTAPGDIGTGSASESNEFGGFTPDTGGSPETETNKRFGGFDSATNDDSASSNESQNSGGSGANDDQSNQRQKRGVEVLNEVRDEYSEVNETLDEIQAGGLQPVHREMSRTRHLLTEVQRQLDTAERQLTGQFAVAIETVGTTADRVEDRIDTLEEFIDDFDGGGDIGDFDDDFDDGFDGGVDDFDSDF